MRVTLRDLRVGPAATPRLLVPSLDVAPGERWAILGPNGAGKTTLLRTIGLLEPPTAGSLLLDGRAPDARTRRGIGHAFQHPVLLGGTLLENAALPLTLAGVPRAEAHERTRALLDRLGLSGRSDVPARTLSGGERRRLSLARALLPEPALLLLDEPLSALDEPTRRDLLAEQRSLLGATPATVLAALHRPDEVRVLATHVAVLLDGHLVLATPMGDLGTLPADHPGRAFLRRAGLEEVLV